MATHEGHNGGVLPMQLDLQIFEEMYPILSQNSEPIIIRMNGYQINPRLSGKTYIFVDDAATGGAEWMDLPDGITIGYRQWFQNDRDIPVTIRMTNGYEIVIPPLQVREARWDGRIWKFSEDTLNDDLEIDVDNTTLSVNDRDRTVVLLEDVSDINVPVPRIGDTFRFLNKTGHDIDIHFLRPAGGSEVVTIGMNFLYAAQWTGSQWLSVDRTLNELGAAFTNLVSYMHAELLKLYTSALVYKGTIKESELPIVPSTERTTRNGWFYYITDYDVTSPGHAGSAVWNMGTTGNIGSGNGDAKYDIRIDVYQHVDDDTIGLDQNLGELYVKPKIWSLVENTNKFANNSQISFNNFWKETMQKTNAMIQKAFCNVSYPSTMQVALQNAGGTTLHTINLRDSVFPIGSFYAQYPDAASNDYATAFPDGKRPSTLFGGTWAAQFENDECFFRTGGSLSASADRTNGLQASANLSHSHSVTDPGHSHGVTTSAHSHSGSTASGSVSKVQLETYIGNGPSKSGVFSETSFNSSDGQSGGVDSGANIHFSMDPASYLSAATQSISVNSNSTNGLSIQANGNATESRPKNRRFIVWKRTA